MLRQALPLPQGGGNEDDDGDGGEYTPGLTLEDVLPLLEEGETRDLFQSPSPPDRAHTSVTPGMSGKRSGLTRVTSRKRVARLDLQEPGPDQDP